MQLSQKPKSLFCYACGREFGTTSLSIHLKSCIKKFQTQQLKKEPKDRIKLPQAPQELEQILAGNLEQIQVYNKKASNMHKYEVLPKCRFCSRTFNQQSLKTHQNGCSKKGNQKIQQKNVYNLPDNLKKPRTLTCCVCGRDFGLTSLKIHYPQCLQKFRDDEKKKPKQDRREPPEFSSQQIDIINNKQDWTLEQTQEFNNKANQSYKQKSMVRCPNCGRRFIEESYLKHKKNCVMINGNKSQSVQPKPIPSTPKNNLQETFSEFKKPRTLTCCVCGRDFGLTSLKIHYPQCLNKFKIEQMKKPKGQRRLPPQFSEQQLQIINNKQDWTLEEIQEFNNKAGGHYREKAMVQCPNCGRKFLQESYLKHKKNCVLINGTKNNVPQKNRNASSDVHMRTSTSQLKKPRTLTCCVCGRDFGLTSLKIHYPQCLQKFYNDQKKKPKEERKVPPQFTEEQLQLINNKQDWTIQETDLFNTKANSSFRDKAMVECPNCGRKFLQASYLKHKKNCVLINGAKKTDPDQRQPSQSKKQSTTQIKKPKVLMCHICGRQFGLTSLTIHLPNCRQKFQNLQKKKEKEQERRPLPVFPQEQLKKFNLQKASQWQLETIQQYNKIANQVYRAQSLCSCPICGRKFFQQSLPKHVKFCQKNKQRQEALEEKAKNSSTPKNKSFSKQNFNKKTQNSVQCDDSIKKIQQVPQESLNSSPQDIKKPDNESFLKKSFYLKMQNGSEDNNISNNISQVDESLQQTGKAAKNIQVLKIQQNQSFYEESNDFKKKQSEQKSQVKEESLINKIKSNQIKQSPIRQSRLRESQDRLSKNKESSSQIKQLTKKQKQIGNKSQMNKSMANQSRYNDKKEASRPGSRKGQSNNISILKESKNQQNPKKLDDIKVDLPFKSQNDSKQISRQIISPVYKARQGKGFAAPRKKEQNIRANMKQCKICKRKFDEERIEKHEKLCLQNQEKQKKSEKIIQNTQPINQSIRLKTSQRPQSGKQQTKQRDILSPQQKIRLKKGFAAPRQKQSQIQSLMAQCRGCKRKFTSDRIQKHEGICKQAQQNLKQPFVAGTYKKIQQNTNTIQGQKVSIRRVACPKCNRKFAQQRLQKHVQVCKAVQTEVKQQKPRLQKKLSITPNTPKQATSVAYNIDQAKIQAQRQASQNMNLQMCEKCGRKFLAQRIAKHSQICKGTNNISLQTNLKDKKQKQLPPTKQYNLEKLEIKQETEVDSRIECPRCSRKFQADRLDKHLNACKAVPPLNNIEMKTKTSKKQQAHQQKHQLKISSVQSPKAQQKLIKTIGEDQYVQTQLEECHKCSRKFVPQRLQKHTQICKGSHKPKTEAQKNSKKAVDSNGKKSNEQQLKKTKNEFFTMVKDLKNKKIKEEEVQKQLDNELLQIKGTIRVARKQNMNRQNSQKKKVKQSFNRSINLPKI